MTSGRQCASDHAQSERLDAGRGSLGSGPVAHDARKLRRLGKPAAIGLAFQLKGEVHGDKVGTAYLLEAQSPTTAANATMRRTMARLAFIGIPSRG